MRTPAPSDVSLRLVDEHIGAGRGESLKAGAVVSVRVRERLGPDAAPARAGNSLYRVSLSDAGRPIGRPIVVSSAFLLEAGAALKARVERSGATVILRIAPQERPATSAAMLGPGGLPREAAAALLARAGLPVDAAAFAALSIVLREGIAPDARVLTRVRRVALREAAEGTNGTELAARMEAKGLAAEGPEFEALMRAYYSGDPLGDGSERKGAGMGLEGEKNFTESAIPEETLPQELAKFLRGIVLRTEAEGGQQELLSNSLGLFNHLRGPEGSWVIVPFRFALDAVDFAGTFRILLPYIRGGPGRLEGYFAASRGARSERWSIFINFGGGRASSLRIEAPERRELDLAGPGYEAFVTALAALSCRISVGGPDGAPESEASGLNLDA